MSCLELLGLATEAHPSGFVDEGWDVLVALVGYVQQHLRSTRRHQQRSMGAISKPLLKQDLLMRHSSSL